MFDVSLSELMVIGVVALVVIGPERLPRVARTLGHLLGRLQRYVGQVKADINREMQLDDLKKFQEQMASEANKIKSSFTDVGDELRGVGTSLSQSIGEITTEAGAVHGGISSAPTGENASTDPPPQFPSSEETAKESGLAVELQADADDWKLPEPLPDPTPVAVAASTARGES